MDPATYQIDSLADLTDDDRDRDKPVPEDWLGALQNAFPDIVINTELIRLPSAPHRPDSTELRALIPKTTIILKLRPAVWDLAKAFFKAVSAFKLHLLGQDESALLASGAAINSLANLRKAVEQLDANVGQYCTYLTTISAAENVPRIMGFYPNKTQMWKAHQHYQQTCQRRSCQYFGPDKAACGISAEQWEAVVNDLQKRGVLQLKSRDTLWPVL